MVCDFRIIPRMFFTIESGASKAKDSANARGTDGILPSFRGNRRPNGDNVNKRIFFTPSLQEIHLLSIAADSALF